MQNTIIGRKEEIALLEKYMTFNHSEFIARPKELTVCFSLRMENYRKNTDGYLLLFSGIRNLILLSLSCWRQSHRE